MDTLRFRSGSRDKAGERKKGDGEEGREGDKTPQRSMRDISHHFPFKPSELLSPATLEALSNPATIVRFIITARTLMNLISYFTAGK